eukprot:14012683-Alexandrium_andersonii.AAC.1
MKRPWSEKDAQAFSVAFQDVFNWLTGNVVKLSHMKKLAVVLNILAAVGEQAVAALSKDVAEVARLVTMFAESEISMLPKSKVNCMTMLWSRAR